ncbi:MAG TPA: HAMP domain-containing sensor histidine kinase [Chloroflexota bacterium]|nr:HAMP domain-containing sensor histidine kinase [Chloroflexota bacterium]
MASRQRGRGASAAPGQSVEDVAALIGHELRTPLTVLYSCLQLLDRTLPDDSGAARHYLEEALAEARQLNLLTGQLVEAARLHDGLLQTRRDPLDLNDLVRGAATQAHGVARGQHIAVSPADRPVMVLGDRRYLERALVNLLSNAITYAPGTERIDVRVEVHGAEAAVHVTDYGPGLATDDAEQLTQAFYQAPQTNRPSRGGLGLGLYLSSEFARLHGGRLDVHSAPGRGSTFSLLLPLAEQRVHEEVSAPAGSGNTTVH